MLTPEQMEEWLTELERAHNVYGDRLYADHAESLRECRDIVRAVAESDPENEWRCRYCGGMVPGYDRTVLEHDPDCIWLRARWVMGEG